MELPTNLIGFAQSLSLFQLVCIGFSLSGLNLYLFWKAHDRVKLWRLINGTPTQKIRSCAQGYAELSGQAVMLSGDEIRSPGGRRCVWFKSRLLEGPPASDVQDVSSAEIFKYQGLGLDGERYGLQASDHLFGINDDSGLCIVDPEGAEIFPSTKQRRRTLNNCAAAEQYILENDTLYVLGHFESLDVVGITHDRNAEAAARVRHWKTSRYPELVAEFDQDGDGELDIEEWANVRKKARGVIASEYRERVFGKEVHLIRKPNNGKRYIIAASTEGALQDKLRRSAVFSLVAAFVPASLFAFLLLARSVA